MTKLFETVKSLANYRRAKLKERGCRDCFNATLCAVASETSIRRFYMCEKLGSRVGIRSVCDWWRPALFIDGDAV